MQGDEPFVDPKDLKQLMKALEADGSTMATLYVPITDPAIIADPNAVKVVKSTHGYATLFQPVGSAVMRQAGDDGHCTRNQTDHWDSKYPH